MSSRELNILIKAKNLASGAIKGVKSELKGLDKTVGKGLSKAWKNTEKGIVIGAGLVAGGLGYAATKAIAWEDAFAGVKKTVNETDLKKVGLDFNSLAEQFRDMARNMPVTAEDLAHIGEAAGALGIRAEDIKGFTEVVAKLGVTTDLTNEDASDALGHLGNVLHLTGDDYEAFADSLVALGNNGASTESQIIAIAERFGAAGKAAGLSTEDILGLSSATASMGVDAEAGGSALSRVFNSVATNIGTGSAKAKAFAKTLGMSAKDFKKAWEQDAIGTFDDFLKKLSEMDQFDAAAALKSIGITNTRDVNAIRLLAGGYDELNKQLDVSRHAAGAMDKEAQQRFATTKSQLQILKNNADDAAITIGAALLPKINELAKKATDWLKNHQPEVKKFASDIAAGFEKAVTWASKLDWEAIGNTLKTVGGVGKTLLEAFLAMPSWVQVAVATGWGLNKFTGGAVGTIVGELGKGLIKGVLNMNAGVVNVKGAVVNTPGGGPGGPSGPGGGKPGKSFLDKIPSWVKTGAALTGAAGVAAAPFSGGLLVTGHVMDEFKELNNTLKGLGLTDAEIGAAKFAAGGRAFQQSSIKHGFSYSEKQQAEATAKLKAMGYTLEQGVDVLKLVKANTRDIPVKIKDAIVRHAASDRQDSQREQARLEGVKAATQRGLAANLARLDGVTRATRAVPPALSRIEGVERGQSGTLHSLLTKKSSVVVNLTAISQISIRALAGNLNTNTYTTVTGRRGGALV